MTNIYDTANQLERELRNMDAYKSLQACLKEIQANPSSKELYQEFRNKSQAYQTKIMQGQEVSEEDLSQLQALTETIRQDQLISKLMEVEQQVGLVINDINRIITKPLNDLYELND